MIDTYIAALADYAVSKKLVEPLDRTWAINRLLPPLRSRRRCRISPWRKS